MLDHDTDVEEYRFADRHTATRAWNITSALVARHPHLFVAQVVDEDGVPLLIVHDESEALRIQFDLFAWILFKNTGGEMEHLYWDEVFAHDDPLDVVHRLEDSTGLGRGVPDLSSPRALTYMVIAAMLRAAVDTEPGIQVRQVKLAKTLSGDSEPPEAMEGFPHAAEEVTEWFTQLSAASADPVWIFHEPLWQIWRGADSLMLFNSQNGRVHLPSGPHQLAVVHGSHRSTAAVARTLLDPTIFDEFP